MESGHKINRKKIYIYIISTIAVLSIIGFGLYTYITGTKDASYKKGQQDGLEYAEYYCNDFQDDYIGSREWIKIYEPELYNNIQFYEYYK